MTLDTFQRRRALAVLALAGILVVACLAMGNAVVAVALVVLAPVAVFRVTGLTWNDAFARGNDAFPRGNDAFSRGNDSLAHEPVRAPTVPALSVPAHRGRRPPPSPQQRVVAIALLVGVVPLAVGLLSALAVRVVGAESIALGVGILMTLTWTALAALLAGLVAEKGRRLPIALGAGSTTAVSVLVWAGVIFG